MCAFWVNSPFLTFVHPSIPLVVLCPKRHMYISNYKLQLLFDLKHGHGSKSILFPYLKKELNHFIMPKGASVVQRDKATREREKEEK